MRARGNAWQKRTVSTVGRKRHRVWSVGCPTVLLMLMCLLAYTYSVPRGLFSNADTRIALTRAIVDDHTVRIDPYVRQLVDRSWYQGHFYTDKAPGISLLAVPVYAALRALVPHRFFDPRRQLFDVVRYLLTALVVSLPAALFVGVFWRFLLPVLGRRRAAVVAVGYGLGTMAWSLSALLFSHSVAAMSLFGAFMLLYPVSTGRAHAAWWRWAGAGMLCGLAALCEYPAALIGLLLTLFGVQAARGVGLRRGGLRLLLFVVAGLALLAPLALYNQIVYGNPFTLGYAHEAGDPAFARGMQRGLEGVGLPHLAALWGITFSPYRGLFVLSPFLLLALPGLAAMWRRQRQRPAAALCACSVAAMLLVNSGYYMWYGGASLGPRHFGPALPFLVFPIAFAVRRSAWKRLGPWLIGVSIAVVGLSCITVLIFETHPSNPLIQLVLPRLLHGPRPNNWGFTLLNWGMLLGLHGAASFLPLAGCEALLAFALGYTLRQQKGPRRRDLALSGACALPAGRAQSR
jgi:hypothetical protein